MLFDDGASPAKLSGVVFVVAGVALVNSNQRKCGLDAARAACGTPEAPRKRENGRSKHEIRRTTRPVCTLGETSPRGG
ncbi:hypothetical protein C7S16_0891 [Burkholderia thailandensis]|uniref:Uncharacterized protein n=1 Tax=Burkholderia thailandensis TaxID=57975 RepID=A0AAW9CW28_BURTH|nr:hypothetical protein [Burkholderia thailandensis]MDW9254865.1 hypothetical protein [Burkholderia thailandensis]